MPHRIARLNNPFYVIPFEVALSIYIIINGFLTLSQDSVVLQNLYSLVGLYAFAAPLLQMVAGVSIVIGIGKRKANIESAGLCLCISIFLIRAIALALDGEITLTDMNSMAIVVLVTLASLTRLNHILVVNKFLKTAIPK